MVKKSDKICIRAYTEVDFLYTHDLHLQNMKYFVDKYWGDWNSAIFKKDVAADITWIIEYVKQTAGFFVLSLSPKAHLKNIQIHSSFQNKGIGQFVLKHCEQESKEKGFNELFLEVFLENRAKKLYERLGYTTYKKTNSHYMMKKDLKSSHY